MKTLNAALLAVLLASPGLASAKVLEVDPAHSSVNFEAVHLAISTVNGRFAGFNGMIDFDEKDLTKSKVDFTVDVTTINTNIQKRDDHLRSAEFFDVRNHPKSTFKSTAIRKSGKDYVLEGELTIRGVTKKIALKMKHLGKVQDPMSKTDKYIFTATGQINRKDFGVSYGPNAIVSDKVDLSINLETVPAVQPQQQARQ